MFGIRHIITTVPSRKSKVITLLSKMSYSKAFSIETFDRKEDAKMAEFLKANYFQTEPVSIALGMDVQKELTSWFQKYIKANLNRSPPVSSKAVDTKTGKLIGLNYAIIYNPNVGVPPQMSEFITPEEQPINVQICRFLNEIEEGIDAAEFLGVKSLALTENPKTLWHMMLSVDKNYQNMGIATELITKSEKLASKVKDCKAAQVVSTSEFSYRAYLKLDYQLIREFQYEIYKDSEKRLIFKDKEKELGESKNARVLIKEIINTYKNKK